MDLTKLYEFTQRIITYEGFFFCFSDKCFIYVYMYAYFLCSLHFWPIHRRFPGVLWLWHFLYSVRPHPVSSRHIYTFVVSQAFMAGAASHTGDADSSRVPGLTSGLQGFLNVHRGALLLVSQWQCISSFVFYIGELSKNVFTFGTFVECDLQTLGTLEQGSKLRYHSIGNDEIANYEKCILQTGWHCVTHFIIAI